MFQKYDTCGSFYVFSDAINCPRMLWGLISAFEKFGQHLLAFFVNTLINFRFEIHSGKWEKMIDGLWWFHICWKIGQYFLTFQSNWLHEIKDVFETPVDMVKWPETAKIMKCGAAKRGNTISFEPDLIFNNHLCKIDLLSSFVLPFFKTFFFSRFKELFFLITFSSFDQEKLLFYLQKQLLSSLRISWMVRLQKPASLLHLLNEKR